MEGANPRIVDSFRSKSPYFLCGKTEGLAVLPFTARLGEDNRLTFFAGPAGRRLRRDFLMLLLEFLRPPNHRRVGEDNIPRLFSPAFLFIIVALLDGIDVLNDIILQHGFQILRVHAHVRRADETILQRAVQEEVAYVPLSDADDFEELLVDINIHRQRGQGYKPLAC